MNEKEIDARMEGFNEAIEHLGLSVCDTEVERKEYANAAEMIRELADSWYKSEMPL